MYELNKAIEKLIEVSKNFTLALRNLSDLVKENIDNGDDALTLTEREEKRLLLEALAEVSRENGGLADIAVKTWGER